MKASATSKKTEEMPIYRLGRHWNTIQAFLFPGLEDDTGELSEEQRKFVQICEILINGEMFAKYRWCGNGRPPHSRISLFKAYILKAMRNYPYTTTLIAAIRESPTLRRLCGWEALAEVPHESQFSRAFRDFSADDLGSKVLDACLAENLGRNGTLHASHDSSEIEARENTRRKRRMSRKPSARGRRASNASSGRTNQKTRRLDTAIVREWCASSECSRIHMAVAWSEFAETGRCFST